jgi:hypothetical protein
LRARMECDDVGGHIRGLMNYEPANRSLQLLRPLAEREMVMPGTTADLMQQHKARGEKQREMVIPGTTADLVQQQKAREKQRQEISYTIALLAGGCAGTSVDVTLFPIDTIKTRMQVCASLPS